MIDFSTPRTSTTVVETCSTTDEAGYLSSFRQRIGEKMTTTKETTVEYVQRNPYQALAMAAAAGFLVGLILKRR